MKRRSFCYASASAAAAAFLSVDRALAAMLKVTNDVDALTVAGNQATLRQSAVQDLSDRLRGPLLLPGNPVYDSARHVLNAAIDKHPALIVQASGVADISSAINFARENKLLVAVKCGGHSSSGMSTCDGGMMIDLSRFRHVQVERDKKLARVSGGSLLGAMDHETMAQGLVTVAGTVSHTGVGGLATGGGFGRLARRYGLALDNIRAVDIVGADGLLRHASAEENQDLYWGVRGAGGNFGVVTSFEFELHSMSRKVLAGNLVYPINRLRDVLEFYAEYTVKMPDELGADLIFGYPTGGKPGFIVLALCYSGDHRGADTALAAVKKLGEPMAGKIESVDYVALQRSGDSDAPRVTASYLKGGFISEFSQQLIDTIVDEVQPHPHRSTLMIFQQAGGAIARIAVDATAFPHRYAEYNMMVTMGWEPGSPPEEHVQAIRRLWRALIPFTHGFYTVEAQDDNAQMVNKNYQGNYARLLEIKRRYDPGNLFRLNANISP